MERRRDELDKIQAITLPNTPHHLGSQIPKLELGKLIRSDDLQGVRLPSQKFGGNVEHLRFWEEVGKLGKLGELAALPLVRFGHF